MEKFETDSGKCPPVGPDLEDHGTGKQTWKRLIEASLARARHAKLESLDITS